MDYQPTDHPLWDQQVALEQGMLCAGYDTHTARANKLMTTGRAAQVQPVRALLEKWLPDCAKALRDWVAVCSSRRGVRPLALDYISGQDYPLLCAVGLRTLLNRLATPHVSILGLSATIGRLVEHELRVQAWAKGSKSERALYRGVVAKLEREGATSEHRQKVLINRMSYLQEDGKLDLDWTPWSRDAKERVGAAILEAICRATGWFEAADDPEHVYTSRGHRKPRKTIQPRAALMEAVGEAIESRGLVSPELGPMVIPPRPWVDSRSGGYWTEYVSTPRLVRFKASQENQRRAAADEYDALDMPLVYESLNFVGDTGWRINKRVYEVAQRVWQNDMALGGLPVQAKWAPPPKPEGADEDPEIGRKYRRALGMWHKKWVKHTRLVLIMGQTMGLAEKHREYPSLYFPHMLDFRGRMYPIPVGLHPQGNELSRGLLEFDRGVPVQEEDAGWLAINITSHWGNDKMSFEDRIAWVEQNEAMWRRIAADPLGSLEWSRVDHPWQCLAAILDWVGYLEHGPGYVSHSNVMEDGTCNGLQHLSAMTLDREAGTLVNLTPGDQPRDIYKHAAGLLQKKLELDEQLGGTAGEHATYWLDLCGRDLPRSLTKRQVMVLPYGGTRESFVSYTAKWLDEADPLPEDVEQTLEDRSLRWARVRHVADHLWTVVHDILPGAMAVMEWMRAAAKEAAVGDQPVFWTTPAGFVVRHFYGKQRERKVVVALNGQSYRLTAWEPTEELDLDDQLKGIPPNFTHSLDAAALMLTIVACKDAGLTHFSAIHDAYGTHAGNMWKLHKLTREAFIQCHEAQPLHAFRMCCANVVADYLEAGGWDREKALAEALARIPEPPRIGTLDLAEVAQSDYFFA